ncbi:MAG: hypothetical protein K0R59_4541 [Sphingobacterium sp.]|jgi:acetyltransferase-like isoleucine patch superfamily enzyme|nr:hypothetical protein [Sphingobacterium sp.]MDF2903706.1 hypothetical protein [Bacillus sp. (in: firmicutes)]
MILLISIFFPNPLKIFIYKKFLGWKIGKNVHIGMSYINVDNLIFHDNVTIGHFNIIKKLKKIEMGQNSGMFNFNEISGGEKEWENYFVTDHDCKITSKHHFDAGGGIQIGFDVIFAGCYSQVWTHELNFKTHLLITRPVIIGSNIYIGSKVGLSPGTSIPSHSVIAMGSIVPRKIDCDEWSLIAGNPAEFKKNINH